MGNITICAIVFVLLSSSWLRADDYCFAEAEKHYNVDRRILYAISIVESQGDNRLGQQLREDAMLEADIKAMEGCTIKFSNGCVLDFHDDDGFYWGYGPYGQDWVCNVDGDAMKTIIKWLEYWNKSRTENEDLIYDN